MTSHPLLFVAPTRIGDAVLATSVLAHAVAELPAARVTIATSPLAAPLFEGLPQLARIIPMVKRSYNRHWLGVWRETVGTRWTEIWDVRDSILSHTLRAGAVHRFHKPDIEAPKVKQYEQVLATGPLPYPTLWPRASDTAAATALMPGDGRYLIFAPIANWAPKEWPLAHYIALSQTLLTGPFQGYRPVIICAGHEQEKARPMLDALRAFQPLDITDGRAHLLTIYAIMQRAQGFVGNDSGLMHMAAASSIPTLGLFGPSPAVVYQPWGKRAAFLTAPENDLSRLSPDAVAQKLQSLVME